jgi:hypothetical protein
LNFLNRRLLSPLFVFVACLLLLSEASGASVSVGPGAFEAARSRYAYQPIVSGWFVGPVTVEAEPEAGYWAKELRLPRWVGLEHPLTLVEVLRVGSGFSWSGWREEFLSACWDWTWGGAYALSSGGSGIPGFSFGSLGTPLALGDISAGGNAISFAFGNALAEGSWLVLIKKFVWTGDNSEDRPRSVVVAESPVPVPAAFWLLGSGILGMVLIRRRPGNFGEENSLLRAGSGPDRL